MTETDLEIKAQDGNDLPDLKQDIDLWVITKNPQTLHNCNCFVRAMGRKLLPKGKENARK